MTALPRLAGPLSALWGDDAQLTCAQTVPFYPRPLFILPRSNPASTSLLFPFSPVLLGVLSER